MNTETIEVFAEIMQEEMPEPIVKTELTIAGNKISAGLVAFQNRKETLIQLKNEAQGLTIKGVEDKDGFKNVSTMRKRLKSARVETENEAKSMRSHLTKIAKDISAKEAELVEIIKPTELELQKEEDRIEEEKQKIADQKEKERQDRIQARVDTLATYGYKIDVSFLEGLEDEQFNGVVESAKDLWQKEQERIAEENRLAEVARQQAEKDRQELEELRKQKAEQDRLLAEKQKEIEEQEKKLKEEKIKVRVGRLVSLGMTEQNLSYNYGPTESCSLRKDVAFDCTDEFFDKYFNQLEVNISEAKKIESERKQKEIADAAEKLRLQAIADEAEKKRLEDERLAQSTDKTKWGHVIEQLDLLGHSIPEMKSKKSQKLSAEVKAQINSIVLKINSSI